MAMRDYFDRIRNYFVEDSEEDYDEDEEIQSSRYSQSSQTEQMEQEAPRRPVAEEPVERPAQQSFRQTPPQSQTQAQASNPRPSSSPIMSNQTIKRKPVAPISSAMTNTGSSRPQPTLMGRVAASQAPIFIGHPKNYKEIMEIANRVRSGEIAIIVFDNMADQQARRAIDFLTGVVFSIDGDIRNPIGQTFIVAPAGVPIEGSKELTMLAGQNFENFDFD